MKDQLKAYCSFNQSEAPVNILPLEQMCHLCCGNFSKPLFVSTIAKIFCKAQYLMCSLLSLSRILSWYIHLR